MLMWPGSFGCCTANLYAAEHRTPAHCFLGSTCLGGTLMADKKTFQQLPGIITSIL